MALCAILIAGNRKIVYSLGIFALAAILAACMNNINFSSPEKNHETMNRAFETKDFDLFLECFYDRDNVKKEMLIFGQDDIDAYKGILFETTRIVKSEVIDRAEISPTETVLTIKASVEKFRSSGKHYLINSTSKSRYIKQNGQWKVLWAPSEKIEYRIYKWAAGEYVPKEVCTKMEAYTAEVLVRYLDTWKEVWRAFMDFGHCDDGAIAEGFDEAISSLWADHWDALPEMVKLTATENDFKEFIYKRIDPEAISDDRWNVIVTNARDHCPPDAEEFCLSVLEIDAINREIFEEPLKGGDVR